MALPKNAKEAARMGAGYTFRPIKSTKEILFGKPASVDKAYKAGRVAPVDAYSTAQGRRAVELGRQGAVQDARADAFRAGVGSAGQSSGLGRLQASRMAQGGVSDANRQAQIQTALLEQQRAQQGFEGALQAQRGDVGLAQAQLQAMAQHKGGVSGGLGGLIGTVGGLLTSDKKAKTDIEELGTVEAAGKIMADSMQRAGETMAGSGVQPTSLQGPAGSGNYSRDFAVTLSDDDAKRDIRDIEETKRRVLAAGRDAMSRIPDQEQEAAVDMVRKAPAHSFRYKKDAQEQGAPPGRRVGVMADDLEKSEMGRRAVIDPPGGGYKRVDTDQQTMANTAVASAQQEQLDEQQREIEEQKDLIRRLVAARDDAMARIPQ